MAKKKKFGASLKQQVDLLPIVKEKAPKTISTNVSTGGMRSAVSGTTQSVAKSARQKAEEDRSARMRQGLSSVVRSSFNRQMSRPTYINKNTVNRLNQLNKTVTNPLAPIKQKQVTGGNGVGGQRLFSKERSLLNNTKFATGGQGVGGKTVVNSPIGRVKSSVLAPVKEDIQNNYYDAVRKVGMKGSRNERKVYVPLSQRDENGQISTNQRRLENAARGGNRKAQVEAALARTKAQTLSGHTYDQYVNAELNKKGLLGQDYILRSKDPSKEAMDYRKRYGFDKEALEAVQAIANNTPASGDYTERFNGQDNGSAIDRLKFGFGESYRARNIEDTLRRQYGVELSDEDQAKMDAVRGSGGYMVGNMLGQASQFAMTAPLSPLVEQGLMARMGLKGGRAAINTTKDAVKYAIARIGADQVVSAPVNMIDALKGEDTKEVALRFFYNTGLDVLFGGLLEIPSLRTNAKFVKAIRANDAANAMEEGAEQVAAKVAAEKQLSEAISSFNPVEQRAIRDRMRQLAEEADIQRDINRGFAGDTSASNLDIYNEELPSELSRNEARRLVDTEPTPNELVRERAGDFRNNSEMLFQDGGIASREAVNASIRHGVQDSDYLTWRMAYDAARRNGMVEDDAIRYADDYLVSSAERARLVNREPVDTTPRAETIAKQPAQDNSVKHGVDYIPTENKGKIYNADEDVYVTRYDNEGADFSNKPQGLYVTHRSTPSVHADAGEIKNHLVIDKNAKFYDTVFDGKLQTNRMPIPIECGTTVNYLVDKMGKGRVEQLLKTNRDDLIAEFGKEYPNVDWSRYYDNLEMVEAYGGLVARKDGIDVVRTIDKSATPDFDTTELSVLNDSVIREDLDFQTGKREPIAEVPKEEINLAQNEIRNANNVSDNATNNAIAETVAKEQPAAKPQESIAKGSAQERSAHFQKHLDNPNANRERGVARQRENALATMKDGEKRKGSFYINVGKVNGETTIGSVNGEYFKQNGIVFGVHKGSGKKKFWFVTDVETGIPVGTGKTKKEALSSIDESAIRNGADRQRAVNQFQKEIDNKVRIDDEQLRKVINSYEGMSDSELMAEKTKLLDTKSSAKEFEWQYDERISLIDDILNSRKKSEPIAEEPNQLYNEPRGDGNGAEKHQSTVERAGSGEEEVRANVGAVQNGERQAVSGTHLENSSNPASTGRTGSTLSLTDEQRAVMDAAGKTNAHLREADYSAFSNALNEGKASNKYGSYVDPQDVDELTKKGAKTFLSDDGSVGFAITKDGDIIGAFNRGGKYRGAVDDMLITARLNGGTKLDCYGIGLVNKYEQAGYIPVARIPFNPEYVNDPLLLANKPDVYVMMKNGDGIDTVIRKNANGEYHVSSPEELDALRTFDDYDEALEYRDNLLKNGGSPKAETAVAKTNVAEVSQKANTAPKTETAVEQTAKKAEQTQEKTWQEHAREDYKTGKQRAKAVEEGKIPSKENGEVVNAIKRLKETKDFSNVKDALNRGVKDGIYNRKIRHLDEEIDKAIKEIEADPEKAINDVLDYHPNGAKANDVPADAIPWVMKGYALCKWADVNGMTALKEDIAATMAKAQSTGGSILRAGQVFTVMADTKTQRDIVAEYVEKMQEKYASRLGDHKLTVSEDLLNKLDNATTDAEKSKILDDITVHVWNQVPQSFTDAMGSLRITSMLANTTTMIRNIASNAGFLGVREVDKAVNTMMEATAEKLNKIDRAHRTHTFYNPLSKENRKIQAFWYRDYGKHRNIIKGQSRWDEGGGTLSLDLRPQEARHFGVKAGGGRKGGLVGVASAGLEGTRKATSWIMDTGDEAFIAPTYADAATQLMVVRGWKIEDLNPARMQEIRDYATLVAQKATYRDPSEFATALAKWGHWQKGDGALRLIRAVGVSGLQPFKKTPINVGKRAVEYSPIGFVKGVYDIRSAIKAGDSTAVNKAITELSKGTTGTGLVVAGYLLAEQGVINAQLPTDDEGYLRRDLGEQDYALNIGGKSRSLQWAAPGAIPILSGATLYDQVRQRGWNALVQPETLVQVLSESANPLLEMSFMQSYMDLLESTDSVKGANKITIGALQIGLSYASQFIPTALGKVANVVDPVRRNTSSQAETPSGRVIQKAINKGLINKIPKWSESLPAYRDAFGNIQTTEDMKDRIIQNFVSPWYTKEIKTDDPVYKELFRINDATPDTNLIPTNAIGKGKHELSLNGETINLDPHDMEEYKKIRGEGNQKALKFIDSDEYKSMSDTEKAKALEDIYENAKVDAKRQMLLKKGKSEWEVYTEGFSGGKADQIGAAKNAGIDPKDYNHTLTDKTADADGNGTVSKSEYYDYLLRQNQYNDKQRAVLMAAKNKSWDGKYNPFVTGEPPKDSQAARAESTSYTDDIKSTGLPEKQFKEITSADTARIDSNGSGRVSQKEYQAYLDSFSYLTDEQKSALWKKYNPHWKKNPYDGSTASSGRSKRGRSGRRSSGGGSSKAKARAKTASEKRFAALQTGKAPTNAKGIEALSNGAKGLTKAQKKALVKLMQKKLNV